MNCGGGIKSAYERGKKDGLADRPNNSRAYGSSSVRRAYESGYLVGEMERARSTEALSKK